MKHKHIFKTLLTLLLMVAAGQGSAWAQTFTIEASHNNSTNVTTFTITRSGSSLPAQTIYYRTVNLSAYAGKHYTAVNDTYTFPAGVTTKQVMVTESSEYTNDYGFHYQTGTTRNYRFEVLDVNGFELQHYDRSMTTGASFSNTYLNSSVTDLVYFTNGGSITSGTGNKYLDVSYSSSNWTQVTDAGYNQGVHTVSTNSLYNSNSTLRTVLNGLNYKMYATVYFTQKEEHDGYQYIQIYTGNAGTYDNVDDPNGGVGTLSNSLYRACFILSYDANVMTSEHYQFFPHRYNYKNKAAETTAGIDHYEFDYDDSYLYAQSFRSNSYKTSTSGSLVLSPTDANINIRFDAGGGGSDHDEWDFKNLKVRLALVDETYPTLVSLSGITVSAGPYVKGNTFYISVPFSEIVNTANYSSYKKLVTTWGDATYESGDGTNVITFKGTINANAGTTLAITSVQCNFKDLAGTFYQGIGNSNYTDSFDKTFAGVTCSATYTLAATNTSFNGLANEYVVNTTAIEPHPTVSFYKGTKIDAHSTTLTESTHYTLAWSDNTAAGTGTVTATGAGSYTGSVSTTFPIRWSTYTVTFHANGSVAIPATGTMSDQGFQYGVPQSLTANAFSREGFTFAGWNTAPDGSGTAYTDGQSVTGLNAEDGGTVDLYAQWAVIPWTGTGDNANDPYIILFASQLDSLAATVNSGNNYSGKFFQLGADITYAHNTAWNSTTSTENNYTPIGGYINNVSRSFQGTFDGDGHTVSGIRIYKGGSNDYDDSYHGLFGKTYNGSVLNVTLADARITGYRMVGGIIGNRNYGQVENCYVTNTVAIYAVVNNSRLHGGIVGYNVTYSSDKVLNCTSAATLSIADGLTGCDAYGGIVGKNDNGIIENCLAVGANVSGNNNVGAIIGEENNYGTYTTNYYLNCTVNGTANAINVGIGANGDQAGARSLHTLTLPADVAASCESIVIDNVTYYASNTTVTLTYTGAPGYTVSYSYNDGSDHAISGHTFTMPASDATVSLSLIDRWGVTSGHDGTTEATAYLISDTTGLNLLARNVNGTDGYTANGFSGKFFKLANNITYSHEGLGATESNYTAIGGYFNGSNRYFWGTFDGDNDTISGIRIYKGGTDIADRYQGIFGSVYGTIKNLTLTDAVITGKLNVAGIAGYITRNGSTGGIIDNCHVTGSVILHAVVANAFYHGGIVGNVNQGSVSNCTSAATLTVADGLTGCDTYGGIVGHLNGNLLNCLALGANVSGTNYVGAVAGDITSGYTYAANYYRGCTVNGTANATCVGIGGESGNNTPHDIAGIRSLHTLTLGDGITATGASETKVIGDVTYYASASTVTLSYTGTPVTGYVFDSISVDAGTLSGSTLTFNPATDVTATAVFAPIVYNIIYDLAGGSASNPATYNIETPTFTLVNPTREGYTFAGWTGTGLDAATTSVSVAQGSIGDRSYTATWTPTVYNITYDLAGGNLATPNPATYTIETPTFTLTNPTREGYTFVGWTGTGLDAATTTVTVAQGSTGDRSYTATWTPIVYNITYDLAGGSASNPATYNIETPTFTLTNPTREGYTFVGWTGTGLDAATTSVSVAQGSTGDRSYTATWTPTVYNITYNLGGGNLATPNPATYTIETPTFTLTNPTREGYTFAGWTGTGLDAATTTVTVAQGSTGDRSYTATWTPIVYNITYDLAGGSASNPATYTIETPTFTLANPAAPIGYTFAGWTGTGLAEATATVTIAQGSIGDRSYTATWTDVWNIAGGANGTNEAPYIITSTAGLDLLATLVNDGNEFSNTFFKLGADIDYPYTTAWNDITSIENNYTAIGNSVFSPFKGTFDGQGHTVSGIRIYKTNTDYQGLFGYIDDDANVKNVTVADARITGDQYVGGIAGKNDANIDNCVSSSVAVTATNSGNAYCGGITGHGIWGDISNCLVLDAIVSGSSNYIGAVAGDAGTNDILYSLYYNCTVGGVENATGVGCNGSDWYSNYHLVPARRLTLAPNVSVSNAIAYGGHYYIPLNRTVTLDYSGAVAYDQAVVYSVGGNELPLNSFTVTADTVVTAAVVSAIQSVPYSYNFEDETPFRYWRPLTGSYSLTYSGYNNTDCLRFFGTTSNLMLLPPFDAEVNTLMLNLKFRSGGNSNYYGTFSVGYVTDAADASTFTAVATYSYAESQGNWIQKAEYFTGIPAGARLALRSNPVYSSYNWYVDDIEVAVAPSCIPTQDLTLANMDAVSASFAWRSVDGAQWEYCLLDTDREPVDADFVASTTASSVTIDNLTPSTAYRFHLRRRCDAQSTSTVGTIAFITPATVPFADDFEATQCRWTVKANSTNCWCQGSAVNNGGSQALYISDDNGTHRHSSSNSGYFYAYMRFSLAAGVYAFSYDWTNSDNGFLRVALVPDNIDLDKSNIFNYLINSSYPPSEWLWLDGNGLLRYHPDWVPRTEVVDVSAAGLYKMVFFWYNYGECDYPAAVDNVRVTIPRSFTTAGRWDVASNWSPAGVPAADESVVVRAAATIPSGCVAMANNISVANDGSLILADGGQLYTHSSDLPITVQKEVRANQWSSFALIGYYSYSPNNVDNLTSAAYDLFGYDEPSATWVNKKNNWLNLSQGYIYRRAADATLSYDNNVYGSGNFGITVYRQYGDDALKGFNLVGNMTPHNVVKGSGLYLQSNDSWATGYYTLEADGSWRAHPDSDSIAPGQAVLVQLTAANETSVIYYNTELDWPSANSKGGNQNTQNNQSTLTFTVSDGEHSDIAYAIIESTSQQVNKSTSQQGLRKFGHQDAELPSLSIAQGDGRYAIAPIAEEAISFDLAFSGKAGSYTLTVDPKDLSYCHLIDRLTGKDIDLLRQPTYTFTQSSNNTFSTRFLIKLSPNAAQSTQSILFAYQDGENLIIEGSGTLQAYDIMGRQLFSREVNSDLRLPTSDFPQAGVYILKINGNSQKIVIR